MQLASVFHFSSGRQSCPRFKTICCLGPEGVRTDSMSWCCTYLFLPLTADVVKGLPDVFLDFSRINYRSVIPEKHLNVNMKNIIQALHLEFQNLISNHIGELRLLHARFWLIFPLFYDEFVEVGLRVQSAPMFLQNG